MPCCSELPPLSNADHKGIYVQTSWRPTAKHNCDNHSKGRVVRCYSQADWEKAGDLIDSFDWNSLLSDDINEAWSNWSQKFLSIMNECIPKKKLPNRKNLPWLSKRLINLIKRRNLLYKKAKLTGNFSKYKAMQNKVTSELRSAKRSYLQSLNPKKSKEFWRAMKYLNKWQSTIPTLVDENNVEATSNSEKADMLNSFFLKCFNPLGSLRENTGCSQVRPRVMMASIVQ